LGGDALTEFLALVAGRRRNGSAKNTFVASIGEFSVWFVPFFYHDVIVGSVGYATSAALSPGVIGVKEAAIVIAVGLRLAWVPSPSRGRRGVGGISWSKAGVVGNTVGSGRGIGRSVWGVVWRGVWGGVRRRDV